jgi:hypothetical protein
LEPILSMYLLLCVHCLLQPLALHAAKFDRL